MEFDCGTDDDAYWSAFDQQVEEIAAIAAISAADDHNSRWNNKTEKRTSPQKGSYKTKELLNSSNAKRHQEQLRMPLDTFDHLIEWLVTYTALRSTTGTTIEEKVYMFLYIVN